MYSVIFLRMSYNSLLCIMEMKKKCLYCSFAKNVFFESPQVSPHTRIKTFFMIYGFIKLPCIHLANVQYAMSICAISRIMEVHLLPSLQPCSSATSVVTQQEKQLKNTEREIWFIWKGNEGREGKRPERNGAWVAGFLKHLAVVVHGDRWLPTGALSYQQTGPAAEAFGF